MKEDTPIVIDLCNDSSEFEQILSLQSLSLPKNLTQAQRQSDGFVTLKHDLKLLNEMNQVAKQVVAKVGQEVIGYALVMPVEFRSLIPILEPMFAMIEKIEYQGRLLKDFSYYVMGQICIGEKYRGQGIFAKLYAEHKRVYSKKYEVCLTEISTSNPRSLRAHEKVGFKIIHTFKDETDEWNIVLWDWK
ncbi:MAG: GNAT family N-acetyltransferase [Bacteriovoracaceae bacterium]|nr:GNAT family N-acetyltransferase [Bacteriovoracaceae bacterium]